MFDLNWTAYLRIDPSTSRSISAGRELKMWHICSKLNPFNPGSERSAIRQLLHVGLQTALCKSCRCPIWTSAQPTIVSETGYYIPGIQNSPHLAAVYTHLSLQSSNQRTRHLPFYPKPIFKVFIGLCAVRYSNIARPSLLSLSVLRWEDDRFRFVEFLGGDSGPLKNLADLYQSELRTVLSTRKILCHVCSTTL